MNKTKQILKDLERLNKTEVIKVDNSNEERLIFKDEETFKIFSNSQDERGLNPFNDYSYNWLSCFLEDLTNQIKEEDDINDIIRDFEDNINEYVDSSVSIYTHNLLKWVGDNNNFYYMDEVMQEGLIDKENYDFIKHLQIAQYKAIEESYFSFLSSLKTYLNTKYNLTL